MAGRGPAPKDAKVRRNFSKPQRGEWIDLPEVSAKAPKPDRSWPARTKRAWESWWADRASTQWTEADRTTVVELGHLHAELVRGRVGLAGEVRRAMDGLGLTQKGKRDLRWRVGSDGTQVESGPVAVMADYRAVLSRG